MSGECGGTFSGWLQTDIGAIQIFYQELFIAYLLYLEGFLLNQHGMQLQFTHAKDS